MSKIHVYTTQVTIKHFTNKIPTYLIDRTPFKIICLQSSQIKFHVTQPCVICFRAMSTNKILQGFNQIQAFFKPSHTNNQDHSAMATPQLSRHHVSSREGAKAGPHPGTPTSRASSVATDGGGHGNNTLTSAATGGGSIPMKKVRKKDTIEMILSRPPMIVKSSLSQLRYHILIDGLKVPKDSEDVS